MNRKRDKPYTTTTTRHLPYHHHHHKRRRPPPPTTDDPPPEKSPPPPPLLITGLPSGCSVMDLKARFEIYGPIARIRIEPNRVGLISFRSKLAADEALAASLDPSFGISVDSHRVQVMWASEMHGGEAAGVGEGREKGNSSSKLLRGEAPLRRHGRANRLSSAIVNPNPGATHSVVLDAPLKPREIVAYDDIL